MNTLSPSMGGRSADRVKIFLVSLNQVVITGVQSVLTDFAPLAHGSGEDFKAIQQVAPHIIILDISGNATMLDLLPTLKESAPSAKTILLAGLDNLGGIREAYRLGVDGIVLTTQPPDVLLIMCHALAPVRRRQNTMPTQGNHQDSPPWLGTLTKQEQNIVELVRQGLSNKEIADRVGISPITVRHHLTNIFDKVGVGGRQSLIIKTFERSTSPIE